MYILLIVMAASIMLFDLIHYKKLRRKNVTGRIIDKLNRKMSKFQYKKGSEKYNEIKFKIKKSGLELMPESYQTIKIILPIIIMLLYILFKIINYLNLNLNIESLKVAAKILENEKVIDIQLNINFLVVLLIGCLSFIIPDLVLNLIIKIREKISENESLILQTYTIMLLKSTKPVKQILISLYERATIFKPYLRYAVNRFSTDPNKALSELKNTVPNGNFKNICISLQQAMTNDRSLSVLYLENNRNLTREINKQIRIRKETKDQIIGMLLMILPMLITICIVGYPWLMYTLKSIKSIPM